jgi:hypothetical protein
MSRVASILIVLGIYGCSPDQKKSIQEKPVNDRPDLMEYTEEDAKEFEGLFEKWSK